MLKTKSKDQKGFTIIEVLIVLAIAGLILLIVFLAVPSLQRNSRNTARRNDVARVGGAATEFVANNNGTLPTNVAADEAALVGSIGTLGSYDFTVATNFTVATGGTPAPITDINQVRLVTGVKCGTNGAVTGVNANRRSMVVQYAVEKSTAPGIPICQEV